MQAILSENRNESLLVDFEQSEDFIQKLLSDLGNKFENPLISVIMPTYNRAHIISNAITSVIEQTYSNWELWVCDDGSADNTEEIVTAFSDDRIKYLKLGKVGAAEARNIGLARANGAYIAYLDTDNVWHPEFLNIMTRILTKHGGVYCAYSKYVDIIISNKSYVVKKFHPLQFNYEELMARNFIDLNTLVHGRELYENLGGFNSKLSRRQDYDLILKYTFLRDPYYVDAFLMIYQRNKAWKQITQDKKSDNSCKRIINDAVQSYLGNGLPIVRKSRYKSVTVLSWDVCRNHFSKAYNIAECLSKHSDVQLIGFRFFKEGIFPPYKNESPSFETVYLDGESLPGFSLSLKRALASIKGDIIYAVKPRLPSFGLALLANHLSGKPFILEINDLESVVSNPSSDSIGEEFSLEDIDMSDKTLLNPYSDLWSKIMESFAQEVPVKVTHNTNLNEYFGGDCFFIRNLKDEQVYNPEKYDRAEIRKQLGFSPEDRIILFGGMLRKHKGIYELLELINRISDPRYKLLFVGSRITPEQEDVVSKAEKKIHILPSHGRNDMAKINLAADVVIVWLDPNTQASHYQMPYKLTDAFAMKVPVIANDISDMGDLGRKGCLRLVDYADFGNMVREIEDIFDEPEKTVQMVERARRLFQREFSYSAGMANFHLIDSLMEKKKKEPLEVSKRFAEFFAKLK
jgi:glycosyltransferase involved in cell wall biosynthesis